VKNFKEKGETDMFEIIEYAEKIKKNIGCLIYPIVKKGIDFTDVSNEIKIQELPEEMPEGIHKILRWMIDYIHKNSDVIKNFMFDTTPENIIDRLFYLLLYKIFEERISKHLSKHCSESAIFHLMKGEFLFKIENYSQAINHLNKVIEYYPESVDTYYNRGLYYLRNEQHTKAIYDFTKVIELEPNSIAGYYFRGDCYIKSQNYREAFNDFTELIDINPDNTSCYFNRCYCYFHFQEYNNALTDINKVINIDPEIPLAYLLRSLCYHKIGEDKKAEKDLSLFKTLNKENLGSQLNIKDKENPTGLVPKEVLSMCYQVTQIISDLFDDSQFNDNQLHLFDNSQLEEKIFNIEKIMFSHNSIQGMAIEEKINMLNNGTSLGIIGIFSSVEFMLKAMEILLDLKKLTFYNDNYLKLSKLIDTLNFEEKEYSKISKKFIFKIFQYYPKFERSLSDVLIRDGEDLFLVCSKLSILSDIFYEFNQETSALSKEEIEKKLNQQASFMFLYSTINKALQEKYIELVAKKEEEKAQVRLDERNKVIADLSHSIKNLIATVIDPLENLKNETVVQPQIIQNALRGANLIREIVSAMNLSFKGSMDDFVYDAQHNAAKDSVNIESMLIESLRQSVSNMFDGKYFQNFNQKYFPKKEQRVKAKAGWTSISQSKDLKSLEQFLKSYFFETDFSFENAKSYSIGNAKGSAVKLLILFQELILNAVKYSAFVSKEKRFLRIRFISNADTISVKVENPFDERTKTKTTGIGHVVIQNFATLLNTEPVISKENSIYCVVIQFENLWKGNAQ